MESYLASSVADLAFRTDINRRLSERDRLRKIPFAHSLLGRPIDLFTVGEGKRPFLLVGTHHASEHITCSLAYDFLFAASEEAPDREVEIALKKFVFFVVPALNPDGIELVLHPQGKEGNPLYERALRMNGGQDFSGWQANARGVDLNHNYSEGFRAYKKIEREMAILPGKTRYSGEYPESEPETRAMADLVRSVDFSTVVSLHTQGEEVYAYPDDPRGRLFGLRAAHILSYRLARAEGPAAYGGLCDYTGALGIPSLTIECGRGPGGRNPVPFPSFPALAERITPALFRIALALPA